MRAGFALAILIGTTLTALADSGLVSHSRPPRRAHHHQWRRRILRRASKATGVSAKGVHVQPTVYGGRYVDPQPNVGHYYPSAGHSPGYGRLEIEPPANRKLPQPADELSSIMVRAIGSAAGAARGAVLSAAGDRRPAKRRCGMPPRGFSVENPAGLPH